MPENNTLFAHDDTLLGIWKCEGLKQGLGVNEIEDVDELIRHTPRARDFPFEGDKFLFENLPKFSKNKRPKQDYKLVVPRDDEKLLKFESRFENGNLKKAIKISDFEYNLIIENDFNTKGHTQWYYFKVASPLQRGTALHCNFIGEKVKFNFLNLNKPQSLYQEGMRPCVFSTKAYRDTGTDNV